MADRACWAGPARYTSRVSPSTSDRVDLLIDDVAILTMDRDRRFVARGWVGVIGQRIARVENGPAPVTLTALERIDGRGGLLVPGFISAHQHVIDILVRGGLDRGRTFMDWLITIYYAGVAAQRPEDTALAATLGMAESLRAGITTVVDNWAVNNGDNPQRVRECAEATLAVYRACGVRAIFARMFADTLPIDWRVTADAALARLPSLTFDPATILQPTERALTDLEDLFSRHHGSANGRIRVAPSPELPQIVTVEGLRGAIDLARRYDTILPIHHCSSPATARIVDRAGRDRTCTDFLDELGFLGPSTIGAHCVAIDGDDLTTLARRDVKVAHCPTVNMHGGGVAPIRQMLDRGMTVGLGADNASANANASILLELQRAALLARVVGGGRAALEAEQAVAMATIEGARAIGMGDRLGSIETGKLADLVLLETDAPHWWPRHDPYSALVHQAHPDDVHTVVIDGQVIVRDRVPLFLGGEDARTLGRRAQRAADAAIDRAGLAPLRPDRGW